MPSGLPARKRDVDGSYLVEHAGARLVAHLEFHRRHQSGEELAVDVAEAQLRLYRRERLPVYSQVWDLYGSRGEAVLEQRKLHYGAPREAACSQCVYQRVNLRGLSWRELLEQGLGALWPLVPLTEEGASEGVVQRAREAIEGRVGLSEAQRADHLAVLSFMAEAEGVPARVLKEYIPEDKLMASTLYQEILAKGEARGEARGEVRGEARSKKETIIRLLGYRLVPGL